MNPAQIARAADAIYSAGHWLLTEERPTDALDIFRTMLLVAPADERSWLGLGACHEALGELERALDLYRLAEHAAGPHARIELARARTLVALGERADGRDAYARALDLCEFSGDTELLGAIQQEGGAA
jgi:tetratricopeptide (TPR) repeat protein